MLSGNADLETRQNELEEMLAKKRTEEEDKINNDLRTLVMKMHDKMQDEIRAGRLNSAEYLAKITKHYIVKLKHNEQS